MNKILYFTLTIMILISCEESTTEPVNVDTDSPVVTFSISEGDELSGEATLYINVEDESEIESVSVLIGGTNIITKTSEYESIVINLKDLFYTPSNSIPKINGDIFEVDHPRSITVKAVDADGNIGESEPKEVLITQFKGWKVCQDFRNQALGLRVDDNGLIWYCSSYAIFIYDSVNEQLTEIPFDNGHLPGDFITGFDIIDGSKAWIATQQHITQYNHSTNMYISTPIPAEPTSNEIPIITAIEIGGNDLYIGTKIQNGNWDYTGFVYQYDGNIFDIIQTESAEQIRTLEYNPDGRLFVSGYGGIDLIKDGNIIYNYDLTNIAVTVNQLIDYVVVDSLGKFWMNPPPTRSYRKGITLFDTYHHTVSRGEDEKLFPILVTKNGYIYCQKSTTDQYGLIPYSTRPSLDLVTINNNEYTDWSELDSPFSINYEDVYPNDQLINFWWQDRQFATEAPNGDIWIIAYDRLWRYRPSIGGFPQ